MSSSTVARDLRRTGAGVGVLFDQRHDHEGPTAAGDFGQHERIGAGLVCLARHVLRTPDELAGAADAGGDRLSAGRRRPEIGDIEVRVQDATEGLRDGRRCQQQDVRRWTFGAERLALSDPEAMLLVDDREGKVPEADGVLHECVGADDDETLASTIQPGAGRRPDALEGLAPGRRAQRSREQRHAMAERLEEASQGRCVLPGQEVGRGEERRLPTGIRDDRHGRRRYRRLARSDVTLEEPQHRTGGGQIDPDVRHGRLLIVGQ